MRNSHEIYVGDIPAETIWERYGNQVIALETVGQRIICNGMPLYVGQSAIDTKYPDRIGRIERLVLVRGIDVPAVHCSFVGLEYVLTPSQVGIPVVNSIEMEKRCDDFFEALQIGDAIDREICESLYTMLPQLLTDEPNFFQLCGNLGIEKSTNGKLVKTYLTVKRFAGEYSPWRYVGHCARGDDLHLGCGYRIPARVSA